MAEDLTGRRVEVHRGRKVTVGTVAKCLWHGATKWGWRVLLEMNDGAGSSQVFTDAKNVRLLKGQPVQQSLFGRLSEGVCPVCGGSVKRAY
ncbi:MAG: hypothetical protein KAJ19_21405 [Gammaproteobacteria bacterium]|nr:hypothetical protein [Gammaproteobacteria bacterium]